MENRDEGCTDILQRDELRLHQEFCIHSILLNAWIHSVVIMLCTCLAYCSQTPLDI